MAGEHVIVVALEDLATAGIVAAGAAQFAMEKNATRIALIHILDPALVSSGLAGLISGAAPMVETVADGEKILMLAEQTIKSEFAATQRPLPDISHELVEGRPGRAISQAAEEVSASGIVLGARRPHALGRLAHPDVVDFLRGHTSIPVHVVALQERPTT